MPPIDLNAFHAAIQDLHGNDTVVVLDQNKRTGAPKLSGLKPAKAGNVDGLETRKAFFTALVKSSSSEEYLKSAYKKLGLDDQTKAHAPLTVKDIKTHLDERSEMELKQFEVVNRPVEEDWMEGDFVVIGKDGAMAERKTADDFVIIRKNPKVPEPATLLNHYKADEVRDSALQSRRDMLCTTLKSLCKVTDAQLQRLDVAGMKDLLDWVNDQNASAQDENQVQAQIDRLSVAAHKINQDEVLTSVNRLETDPEFANKATIAPEAQQKSQATMLQSFLADLVLDSDTTLHDALSPEAHLLATLKRHQGTVNQLMKQIMLNISNEIPPLVVSMASKVKSELMVLFGYKEGELSGFVNLFKNGPGLKERITAKLDEFTAALEQGKPVEGLTNFNRVIDQLVDDRCDKLQQVMTSAFEGMIAGNDVDMEDLVSAADPESSKLLRSMVPGGGEEAEPQVRNAPEANPPEAPVFADFQDQLTEEEVNAYATSKLFKKYGSLNSNQWAETMRGPKMTNESRREAYFVLLAHKYENDAALRTLMAFLKNHEQAQYLFLVQHGNALSLDDLKPDVQAFAAQLGLTLTKARSLDEIVSKGALDPDQGYGKFVMQAMKHYFNSVDSIDKRSMYASLIRNAPTTRQAKDALMRPEEPKNPEVKEVREQAGEVDVELDLDPKHLKKAPKKTVNVAAATLGAFFKGAGPIMQKTLQQLSSMSVPEDFKVALSDMRSKLLPMPDKIVKAMLAKLVEDSHGEITQIVAKETMGAASVAQSILCDLTDKNGETREVVVKLVRPDAAYRADREKRVFFEAAGEDEGMRSSFMGRLERIMEEFDLDIEAMNAEHGKVYDQEGVLHDYNGLKVSQTEKYSDVKAVKIDALSPKGSHHAIIMERAPGETLDRMQEYFQQALKISVDKWHEMKTQGEKAKFVAVNGEKLLKLHSQLLSIKSKAVHFASHWVNEALFDSGFFHGDAHAGNLMVDDKRLTAIDFGNATKLTKEKGLVLRVIAACQQRDADMFVETFRKLLSPVGRQVFDRKAVNVRNRMQVLMDKVTSDSQLGVLIAAAIVELQKMEVEIPAPIYNFSQCQTLIQGTIDQLNDQLREFETHLTSLAIKHPSTRGVNKKSVGNMTDQALSDKLTTVKNLQENYDPKIDLGLSDKIKDVLVNPFDLKGRFVEMFTDFEKGMTEALEAPEHAEAKAAYETFRTSSAYRACKAEVANYNYATCRRFVQDARDVLEGDELKQLLPGEAFSLDRDSLCRLVDRLRTWRVELSALTQSKTAPQEERNEATQKWLMVVDILRKIDQIELIPQRYGDLATILANEVPPEGADVKSDSERIIASFNEARQEFMAKLAEVRKNNLAALRAELQAEYDLREKYSKSEDFSLANANDIRDVISATVDEEAQTSRTKWVNDRAFLDVMAASIFDHKMATVLSMGPVSILGMLLGSAPEAKPDNLELV